MIDVLYIAENSITCMLSKNMYLEDLITTSFLKPLQRRWFKDIINLPVSCLNIYCVWMSSP